MSQAPACRVLAIMGSGETSPTMVTVHKALAARLGGAARGAVLLDTPYAFQENAADISARAQAYFARSVGLEVSVLSEHVHAAGAMTPESPAGLAAIRSGDWVFAGPGSPTYALRRWRGSAVAEALRDRIGGGTGLTIIASAAAAAIGMLAVPVYEIYKVGADPYWQDGLDLMTMLGLRAVVIPHYDNAEGGTHDTRYCYLGERRLSVLERELPADAAVLGVDEHTALIFDLTAGRAEVAGRGGVTVRKAGRSTVLPAGAAIPLAELDCLIRTGTGHGPAAPVPSVPAPRPGDAGRRGDTGRPGGAVADGARAGDDADQAGGGAPGAHWLSRDLPDLTADAGGRFEAAAGAGDASGMVAAILDLEAAIEAWATDTDENDNADRARAVLRGLVVRLGQGAERGLADPADRFRPAIDPLLDLRAKLRAAGDYAASDQIRDALAAAGVTIQDSPDGTRWSATAESRR